MPLYSVTEGTSSQVISALIGILFQDAVTAYDSTYGFGGFWENRPEGLTVYGGDLEPALSPSGRAVDFTDLPFEADTFDLGVFDPPYQTDMGKDRPSVMGTRFSHYPTVVELEDAVRRGTREIWRVSRLGVIIKVQDYNHGNRKVWMSEWVRDTLAPTEPFDCVRLVQGSKIHDPKWDPTNQMSVWTRDTVFWVYRKDGPVHRRRKKRA